MIVFYGPHSFIFFEQKERNSYLSRNWCLSFTRENRAARIKAESETFDPQWAEKQSPWLKCGTKRMNKSQDFCSNRAYALTRQAAIFFIDHETKGSFCITKEFNPLTGGLIWDINKTDFSLFRDTNKAVVTSYAYALYPNVVRFKPYKTCTSLAALLCFISRRVCFIWVKKVLFFLVIKLDWNTHCLKKI